MAAGSLRKPTILISVVSDTICPWCWVGKRNMEASIKKFADRVDSFRVHWKPFFLNEKLTDEGMPIVSYIEQRYGPQAAQLTRTKSGSLYQAGAKVGIQIDSDRWVSNSLRSHCLLDYAATISEGKQNELAEVLFQGHISEGNKISNSEFLLNAVEKVGLDREAAQEHMENSAVKDKILKEYRTSVQEWGVTGVPFFVINTDTNQGQPYALSGAQLPETFSDVFECLLGSSSSL